MISAADASVVSGDPASRAAEDREAAGADGDAPGTISTTRLTRPSACSPDRIVATAVYRPGISAPASTFACSVNGPSGFAIEVNAAAAAAVVLPPRTNWSVPDGAATPAT